MPDNFYIKLHTLQLGEQADLIGIVQNGDNLIAGGTILIPGKSNSGCHLVRFDTTGNVVQHFTVFDSLSTNYSFRDECEVNGDDEKNYYITGDALEDLADFIIKVDQNDSLVFHKKYPYESGIQVRLPRKVLPYQHGLFWLSSEAYDNFDIDVGLHKLDSMGNRIWTRQYGHPSKRDHPWSLLQTSDNQFLIGAYREAQNAPGSGGNMQCLQSWIFVVDSLGEKQWEWFGEPCSSEGVYDLQTTPDGGYIYLTRELEVFNFSNWGFVPKIVRRDANFNLLWERKMGNSFTQSNYFFSLNASPDNGWIATGQLALPEPYNPLDGGPDAYRAACFYKVSDGGDSLWRTCINAPDLPGGGFIGVSEIGGATTISSGSTFAVGSVQQTIPNQGTKRYAWLIKVDNDGCAESFCEPVSTSAPEREPMGVKVYPNPASGHVVFETSHLEENIELELFDATGRLVHQANFGARYTYDTATMPPGVYIYRLRSRGTEAVVVGKLIVKE